MKQSPRQRLSLTFAAGVLGLAMIAISAVSLAHDQRAPTDFGSLPTARTAISTTVAHPKPVLALTTSTTRAAVASLAAVTPKPPAAPTVTGRQPAGTPPATQTKAHNTNGGIPLVLELPTLGVRARIEPVATHQGVLTVPDDPAAVGWWAGSSLPGSASGSTVVDGHIDSASRGTGALWHLSTMTAGERIIVSTATRQVDYRVVALRVYPKNTGIPASVFDRAGPPGLILISCGGPFDADRGSYLDNIAVFAIPT